MLHVRVPYANICVNYVPQRIKLKTRSESIWTFRPLRARLGAKKGRTPGYRTVYGGVRRGEHM